MSNGKERTIYESSTVVGRNPSLSLMLLLFLIVGFLPTCLALNKKILCLHGGGGTGRGFADFPGMRDLEKALPDFDFVYADGGYPVVAEFADTTKEQFNKDGGHLWIPDPPGGKKEPTTDPGFSDVSIEALDNLRINSGPFAGVLGYSQGAAFVAVYLSRVPENTFEFAVSFCGYPTLTHLGILDLVEDQSPFGNIRSLVWIGEKDFIIPPDFTRETISFYESPLVLESDQGGHNVPGSDDPTFEQVVSFIQSHADDETTIDDPTIDSSGGCCPITFPFVCLLLCFVTIFMG